MRAGGSLALPASPPHATFAVGQNKGAPVAFGVSRRSLAGLLSVFSHHDLAADSGAQETRRVAGEPELNSPPPCVACTQASDVICSGLDLSVPERCFTCSLRGGKLRSQRPLLVAWRYYNKLPSVTMATPNL